MYDSHTQGKQDATSASPYNRVRVGQHTSAPNPTQERLAAKVSNAWMLPTQRQCQGSYMMPSGLSRGKESSKCQRMALSFNHANAAVYSKSSVNPAKGFVPMSNA
eukprot:scaffold766_cov343-Pavlova_lutheri.AAC.19